MTKMERLECGGAHMYDEVENASNCLVPRIDGSIKFSLSCVGPSAVEIWKGDVACLDFSSRVSIRDADTIRHD